MHFISCFAYHRITKCRYVILLDYQCWYSNFYSSLLLTVGYIHGFHQQVLNGPDATYKLRQLGYEGTVLGVTGNALVEDCDYFKWKGADDVLPKPVSLALLNNYWRTSGK